ncbi:hypothetical protein GCM10009092_00860 [Bowmanella denitrificans]|uniref:Uncharacterized protein n=1 Tax=Bowmanella denitrificans TaxID=366582 RepID=A0ABN0WK13_9ALTE
MAITVEQLQHQGKIELVIVHSISWSLYQLSIVVNGQNHWLVDAQGQAVCSHNILDLQRLFEGIQVGQMRLQHQSAYDEMIGQPTRSSNLLDVPLGNNKLY